ncbi:unnamed protein product [Pleuronectes platessa]|uniref:Uncharacterized protein n=1 Tax=Pleuronectes platessa TaxID=8262 RepID=A0A9N7YWG1_PLEPL|nr:unnamed protein product [Pleuronectes platessa]
MPRQNVSVAQALQPQDSQSSAIPVVPEQPTPSVADGEPIQQSRDPDLFSQAAVTLTPAISFVNGKQEITLEPQIPGEAEAKGSSTDSMEEPTEIPDDDIYDPDKTESGPAAPIATEGMSDVTVTSADLVPSVLPAEPQITKATEESKTTQGDKESTTVITASVQKEVDESGVTPNYVKSDSTVTQTQKAEDKLPVMSSTEPHTATSKAEIPEETHSTSASPAAADDIQSTLKSASTPSSDDADGSTPTSTTGVAESSSQDVEGGKATETQKEFPFSTRAPLVSSSSAPNEPTAKTEITPPRDHCGPNSTWNARRSRNINNPHYNIYREFWRRHY